MTRYQIYYRGEFLGTYGLKPEEVEAFSAYTEYRLLKERQPGFTILGIEDIKVFDACPRPFTYGDKQ
jgi:hypothetical protein